MAADSKPTIVLVGGAFHTPQSYEKLQTAIEGFGYEVHVPSLPTCNEARPPNADLGSDTELIRSYVENLIQAGRTVVAVGHSYGGQVCSNALCGLGVETRASDGLKGGVSNLIYLVGYALPEATSTLDKFKEFGNIENMPLVFDMAEDGSAVVRDPKMLFGLEGPGITDEDIEAYAKTLCRWSGKGMLQPLERAAWREIPVAYIHTTSDSTIPTPEQQSMVSFLENAGRKVQTFTVESGHAPNFNATQSVADAVHKVLSV
ncbi:alpha/beta-hydrolase [Xylaria cubensis]|nr:alpha/beta-hydrolase [Xylaria cubensis]